MVRRLIAVVLLFATTAVADDARTQRLEKLCRVWAAAKYRHPSMMTRKVDWDGALVRAIPAVRAASTPEQLASAIDAMLKELGDPVTHVVPPRKAAAKSDVRLIDTDPRGVLVVNAGPYMAAHDALALWTQEDAIADAVARASDVRVDLTMLSGSEEAQALDDFAFMPWSTEAVSVPGKWTTLYSGYEPQVGGTSGGYYSALTLIAGKPLAAAAKSVVRRITFVTDGTMPLPAFAVALLRAKKATLESPLPPNDAASALRIDLGGGYAAQIRTSTYDDGQPFKALPFAEAKYPEMKDPDLPYRLLAAFRIWSVIDYFYPYKHLIGDWDAVLREFIPRFEDAADGEAYGAAVMEMTAHIEDGHVGVAYNPLLVKFQPPAFVMFAVGRVENEFAVVEVYDPALPLAVGDVIVTVDGEPLDARVKRLWKYFTASTELSRLNRVAAFALRGPAGSTAQLGVRGKDGTLRTVSVPRLTRFNAPEPKKQPPYRVLDGNIGYVDLRALTLLQVDAMFDALMKTKAIVFDMRGYPNGTGWALASRLNTRHARYGAAFRRPELVGNAPEEIQSPGFDFLQPLQKSDKPLYTGKVVVLIDGHAMSQAEHVCLLLEQAAGATFIGSPTAGANGDVTNFVLPGGLLVRFSGHDVRHADGRQLQRVGIQPDIAVAPTIAGLQAGKDEVLDRAIAYVNGGR
jgi:C-terminal processing protease CtpA/Prc